MGDSWGILEILFSFLVPANGIGIGPRIQFENIHLNPIKDLSKKSRKDPNKDPIPSRWSRKDPDRDPVKRSKREEGGEILMTILEWIFEQICRIPPPPHKKKNPESISKESQKNPRKNPEKES